MTNKTYDEVRAEVYKEIIESLGQPIVIDLSDADAEKIKKHIRESYSFNSSRFLALEPAPKLTYMQLHLLYQDYLQLSTPERFGQYVFNRTGFQVENSYEIKNAKHAYELLKKNIFSNGHS